MSQIEACAVLDETRHSTAKAAVPYDGAGVLRRAVGNRVLGTALFVFAETMFFAGLISAYLVLRSRIAVWPPIDQPRLPVFITAINTMVLLASGLAFEQARAPFAQGRVRAASRWLAIVAVLGLTFLAIQGREWLRLLDYGMTTSSGLYGALFYTLIGAHAVHVAGALVVLLTVVRRTNRGLDRDAFLAMRLFWWFVVGIWPILYGLVYLW